MVDRRTLNTGHGEQTLNIGHGGQTLNTGHGGQTDIKYWTWWTDGH